MVFCWCTRPLPPGPQAFGEVRSLYTAAKARGFVVVSYFDTRAATLAQHTLSGQALAGRALDVHFSLPKDDREAAQVRAGCSGGRGPACTCARRLPACPLRAVLGPHLARPPAALPLQGTLLAAALGSPATRQELLFLFSQWGELREVRWLRQPR